MILIEVIFGAINGNPISIDSALDTASTNPVENRVIASALAEIQNEIYHVQDELDDKEVVDFETKAALDAYIAELLAEGDDEDIEEAQDKLYYAADTNKLYKFIGTADLVEIATDYIIVNGDQTALNTALAAYTTRGIRKVIWINGSTTTLYIFTTEGTTKKLTQTLTYKTGYKTRTCSNPTAATPTWGAWTTKTYSFSGHTHTSANITDLSSTIATAVAGKQDSTPAAGTLTTTATTIVGAINELNSLRKREYSVNFYGMNDTAIEHNLSGRNLSLEKIASANVQTLKYSVQDGDQDVAITLVNGVWQKGGTPASIVLPAGKQIAWKATRADDDEIAEITIKEE